MIVYVPQPGTIPARVIAYFQAQPAGTELSTAALADTLDLQLSSLASCLEFAVKHDVLIREKRDGRLYWRLGAGAPAAAPIDDDEVDDDPFVHRIVSAATTTVPAAEAKLPKRQLRPRPTCAPAVDTEASAAAAPGLRLALWSDGTLVVERSGERHEFSARETKQIVHYLERLAETAP